MSLEGKKLKAELMRVQSARAEMEYTVALREDEVNRLKDHIKIQDSKEVELMDKIQNLKD